MKSSIIKFTMLAAALIFGTSIGVAQTVTVGPTGTYATPCAAFPHLTSGETVQVDANGGTPYYDTSDCLETAPNVTIVGVNGRPIIDGSKAGIAKAMWLIDGHDVIVDNFEFRNVNTSSSSTNAEAIRIENGTTASPNGGNVTVQRSYIHDNFEGILSDSAGGNYAWYSSTPYITFQYDEFANNGYGDGFTHNMYLGCCGDMNFTLQYSWSHDSNVGHTVKDRGPINNILYNLIGDSVGNSSYLLDFPLGGSTYVVGNSLYKLATTNYYANTAPMIFADVNDNGSGDPEYGTANQDLHFINNTMILDPANQDNPSNVPPAFVLTGCFAASYSDCTAPPNGPALTVPAVVENNVFLGGETEATNQTSAFVEDNLLSSNSSESNLTALKFNNAAAFDFRLTSGSPAIQAGVYPPTNNAGTADSKALAIYQYVNPVNKAAWPTPSGSHMDAGAFPYQTITAPSLNLSYTQSVQSPNSGTITVTGLPTPGSGQYNYAAFLSMNQAAIPSIESVASSTGTVSTTFQAYPVAATTVVPIYIYVDGTVLTASVTVTPGPTQLQSVTLDSVYYPTTTTHLLGPGTSPVVVSLSSSNPTILYTPATVTIPSGQLSAENGTLNGALNPPALTQSAPVTLTATYNGQSVYLTAPIYSPGIHNFYCNTCTVTGGTPIGFGLIFAGDIPYGGANVTLTSSNTAAIPNQTFPQAQGINIGNASVATNSVTTSTNVNLTFTFNGATSGSTVTLTPGAGTTITAVIRLWTISGGGDKLYQSAGGEGAEWQQSCFGSTGNVLRNRHQLPERQHSHHGQQRSGTGNCRSQRRRLAYSLGNGFWSERSCDLL